MKQYTNLLGLLLWLLTPGAFAQNAKATLSTRVEGEVVLAAIEIKVDGGCTSITPSSAAPRRSGLR
jgi:hypothetical protein